MRQLERALSIAKNIDNDTIIGDLYKSLGYTCELKSDYENAIKYYLKSLTYKEKLNDIKGQASNYNSIGLIYYYQRNYQQSLDNLKKSIKTCQKNRL
ncbi:MAG TPA: tetratricopeptide repeat protein [Bacteroidales bacterium]|nr:tetratricopeptide repeat protein [Bacteroidales bacterium]